MSIFSQNDFEVVQDVIKSNGKTNNSGKKEAEPDELSELNRQSERIQELIEQIDALPDEKARDMMQECMQEVLSFYGYGLERILGIISKGNNTAAKEIYNNMLGDNFVNGLLLIHDLHPFDLKTRLNLALEKVRPYMDSHGGSVEIVSLENGVAKLKLEGNCKGCPSSSATLELGIKQAIEENCPDLVGLEVEGATSINLTGYGKEKAPSSQGWKKINGVDNTSNGEMEMVEVLGKSLVICKVNDQMYAYKNNCPGCGLPLNTGRLEGNIISCKLGHAYDVQQAGKCMNDDDLHLDPFPLLQEQGVIKVAIG
ncbi:MAG: NifU family protein [Ginsengibacter sp.]